MTDTLISQAALSPDLEKVITQSLHGASPYGSVEIIIQNNIVTQISVRNIKKTNETLLKGDNAIPPNRINGTIRVRLSQAGVKLGS